MSKALGQRLLDLGELGLGEALGLERRVVDRRRLAQRGVAHGVGLDLGQLRLAVAERAQGLGHGAVDDLEVAAAGELLELHQREVGLDAGGVAVHHEADGAGGGDDGDLGVAIAVLLAELQGPVPGGAGVLGQARVAQGRRVERHRRHGQRLVAVGLAVGGAAMVAHHAKHGLAVVGEAHEGAALTRHLGRGGVADAGHDRREGAADGAALVGIVGDARRHEVAADVGVAEPQGAVIVGKLRDLAARELRHDDGQLEHHGPQPHGVLVGGEIEALVRLPELQQVQRGEVARRVVEEHVLGARVRRDDGTAGRAGVPVVDGGVVLQAGVGRVPGGVADLVPEFARGQHLVRLAGDALGQRPLRVILDRAQEVVGDADGVVGVLAGHGEVGVGVPVERVGVELDVLEALPGVLDDLLDGGVGHEGAARQLDLLLQRRVLLRVEAIVAVALAVHAGLEDGLEVLRQRL